MDAGTWNTGLETVSWWDVSGVKGPQDRRAIIVAGEVGPAGHRGGDGAGERKEDTAGEDEGEVSEHGSKTLVLWIDVICRAGAEGGASGWVV